jgi:sugar/nucleoside kinase (ribokinase family)
MSDHDVYAFGVIAPSTLYGIKGAFPAPEGYAEIESTSAMIGGEAANSSIVLSRLGARVKLDGNWIGADDAGRQVKALLEQFRIDTSRLPLRDGYRGVREVVFTAQGTRTIFGTYVQLLENEDWNMPVVTIDCLPHEPLVNHASALVVSESFLRAKFPGRPLDAIFREYLRATSGLVIFTFGERGGWYGRAGQAMQTYPAYQVQAVDTTCAGDSFRAGIVFGILRRWDDTRLVDFAAAVAGQVCMRAPGALNAPGYDETLEFMRSRRA